MITMIDEIYDRNFQSHRAELSHAMAAGFTRVAEAVSNAFTVLNRIEYSAPWERTRSAH